MGFARGVVESLEEQESRVLEGGVDSSFMASFMKSNNYNTTSAQPVIDQPQQTTSSQMLESQQNQDQHHHPHQQISFGMMQSSSSSSSPIIPNFISKDTGAYDLGELDQALFLYLDGQEPSTLQELKQNAGMRPPTLNIFPSQPMHVEPSQPKANPSNSPSGSKRFSEPSMMELSHSKPKIDVASGPGPAEAVKREVNRKGPTSGADHGRPKTSDAKTLRRLAQNREAARKSRLRRKAYVQQLESSRIKLTQIEQEIHRARAQGTYFGGTALLGGDQGMPVSMGNISSDAAVFDMEYGTWLEEHHRLMCQLRNAVQEHLPENELGLFVDNCLAHYDELLNLKSMIAKSDVFHLVSGLWKTPAERCFMWLGGVRPSDLIKIIIGQVEPLTEQQLLGICGLQQWTQEAEEALSQGLGALYQSLSNTIVSDTSSSAPTNMANHMGNMAFAMNKLSTLEGFVRQADNLRHQAIHRLHQILTTHQAALCFLAIAEYFHRLRALSSLWLARPRPE